MGKVSKLIGCIIDGKPKLNRTVDNEDFYTIDVSFRDTVIPVLYSQYLTDTEEFEKDTKIEVTGCLMSDINEGLPVFYVYANSIESADIDAETTNKVTFSCQVTKVKDFSADSRCVDILPLVTSDVSPLDTTSILYLCARGSLARKLKGKEKGYVIEGEGYLKAFRDIYEVYITHVDNLNSILG